MNNDMNVHYTSKSQTWDTPREFFNKLDNIWNFTLDVAALPDSALCENFFTPDDDGLTQDWGNNIVWCNPPYNALKDWTEKCLTAYNNGATVVLLIPSRTDTRAFHGIIKHTSALCLIKGRLKFYNASVDQSILTSAPFPSCLIVLDKNLTDDKIKILDTLGQVMVVHNDNID